MCDGPDTGYLSHQEPRDEDSWAHEMSDEPEQPAGPFTGPFEERHKDLIADGVVINRNGMIEIYGHEFGGRKVWIQVLIIGKTAFKVLNDSDYEH